MNYRNVFKQQFHTIPMEDENQEKETPETSETSETSESKKPEIQESKTISNPVKKTENTFSKIPKHNWAIATYILIVLAIILIVSSFGGSGVTGNVISAGSMEPLVSDFVNNELLQGQAEASLEGISLESGVYVAEISLDGQIIPLYFTQDGKYIQAGSPLASIKDTISSPTNPTNPTSAEQPTEVPKSDKPVVELFIWSYCPYGVQAQGPLAEVASLLGADADFEAVLYYDGHGEYETQQNKIQACIQEVAADKYWDYAASFVTDIYSKCGSTKDVECDKTESVKLMKSLGINDVAVMSCVDSKGENLIAEHATRAQGYGVTGSPSIVINGVTINAARNADAFKTAVCGAFNNAPAECGTALDSTDTAAAGNC